MSATSAAPVDIRSHVRPEVYARGAAYVHRGAVLCVKRRDGVLLADIQGRARAPYRVTVSAGDDGRITVSCNCSYEGTGWCKHVVAALLCAARHPDRIEDQPPLASLVESLDEPSLRALVLRLAAETPDGYETVCAVADTGAARKQPKRRRRMSLRHVGRMPRPRRSGSRR